MKNKLNQIKKYLLIGIFALAVFFVPKPVNAYWVIYDHDEPYTVNSAPPPPANSVTLTANPIYINIATDPNQTSLSWTISGSGVTGCTASSTPVTSWAGSVAFSSGAHGPQPVLNLAVGNYDFFISCPASSGPTPVTSHAYVTVVNQPPTGNNVTASIFANPNPILLGGQSELTWGSQNATSCTGTGFSTGNATGGSLWVSPSVDTQYDVSCSDSAIPPNSANASTILKILRINYFQTSAGYCVTAPLLNPKFAWSAPNATSCTISRDSGGIENVANSSRASGGVYNNADGLYYYTSTLPVVPPSSTYTLTCSAGLISVNQQLVVPVCSGPVTDDFTISASPASQTLVNNLATFSILAGRIGSFTGTVSLSKTSSPLPAGTTYTFNPTTISCGSLGCSSSTLTINTSASVPAPLGTYSPIVIQGSSGALSHTTSVSVDATGKKRPIFKEF